MWMEGMPQPYRYKPTWDKLIERHPDKVASEAGFEIAARESSYICVMEVRRHGALVLRASSDPDTGRLLFNGVSLFTTEDILFDKP